MQIIFNFYTGNASNWNPELWTSSFVLSVDIYLLLIGGKFLVEWVNNLHFFLHAAPPQLIEKPQDVQKLIDDSLVWECKATGKPKPSYRWMKNGENLEPSEVSSDQRERNFKIKDKFASSIGSSSARNISCSCEKCCWVRNEYRRLWGFQSSSSADSSSFADLAVVYCPFHQNTFL